MFPTVYINVFVKFNPIIFFGIRSLLRILCDIRNQEFSLP